jgi:outer membrane protein assembly factor BamB
MTPGNPERVPPWAAGALTALLLSAVGIALLAWWTVSSPAIRVEPRIPTTLPEHATLDGSVPGGAAPAVDIRGSFAAGLGEASTWPGSWPRFRGASFDNIAEDTPPLAVNWGDEGPPIRWEIELGEGHGGAAVHGGRVYLLDYDEQAESDLLRCLSLDDGLELWRRWYRTGAKRNHGISRTVPTVSDRHVLTLGPRCHVSCTDALTGDFLWGKDLVREYDAREPLWFAAQHPILDGDVAVIAPGGRALMIGVDAASGQALWEAPNPRGWRMSHASIVPMEILGRRMYVYAALGGLVGVAADGDDVGTVLWETDAWSHAVVAPSPVRIGDGRVLVTAGFGAGSAIFRITREGDGYGVQLERAFDRTEFASEQHTPILYRDHLFTIMPKDGGSLRSQLVCMTTSGTQTCNSGQEHRFGLGPYLVADDKLLILDDEGVLTISHASPSRFEPLAQARVLQGRDAWAPMALAGGLLLVRDSTRMVCLDLRASAATTTAPPVAYFEEATIPLEGDKPTALAVADDGRLWVAAGDALYAYDSEGAPLARTELGQPVGAMAVDPAGTLYLAIEDRIELIAPSGERSRWEGLGERAIITSLVAAQDRLYAADAGNRVVWRFDGSGRLLGVIGRDGGAGSGFAIPSPSFDVALAPEGELWVVNPGELRVQRHDADGGLVATWGRPGTDIEGFAGCCNPAHIAALPDGSLVTAEKGLARVKVYAPDGRLLAVVAEPSAFEPGTTGLDLAVDPEGRILVLDPSEGALRIFARDESESTGGRGEPG